MSHHTEEQKFKKFKKSNNNKYAKCRLIHIDNIPVIGMEFLDLSIVDKSKLPEWVFSVDSFQVGYDKNGKLKIYDYGMF